MVTPKRDLMKLYSLRKCQRILRNSYKIFQRKKERLSKSDQGGLETELRTLDQSVLAKDKIASSQAARRVETLIKHHFPKSLLDHVREIGYALLFALFVAFLIRQFWFELYEVPTGSMRPTIEELDRLVVSKSTFGISLPFRKKPFLFSDDYVQRGSIVVFTVRDMDIADANMRYFGLIPGKKRYIKRCVAKPGDTIYFYGGYLFGIDKEDHPILELADPQFLQNLGINTIDHIPYISMDGKPIPSRQAAHHVYTAVTIHQMNLPVAQLTMQEHGQIEGHLFNGGEWVAEHIDALKTPHRSLESYSDLWGIGNFAQTRLLTRSQVRSFYGEVPKGENTVAYLELRHTPNLTYPKPELRQGELGFVQPMITPFAAMIPLQKIHLEAIQRALFTARFFVVNGRAYRYQEGNRRHQRPEFDPKFPRVPDGCYEFYHGVGYRVHFGGILTRLPADHPLYDASPENVMQLFNLGIAFNTLFIPTEANQPYNPQRFTYYRNGDLYVMGAPILKKTDPTLIRFVEKEMEKQNASSRDTPYIAFVDRGPPLTQDGQLDVDFIRIFGLKVPETGVVALGDNYAMSADSRDFGFVPTDNLRGAPSFTFWPPGKRLGPLPQLPYPWLTLPNIVVWTLAALVILTTLIWLVRRSKRSVFKD
jgi:signal peptidase I